MRHALVAVLLFMALISYGQEPPRKVLQNELELIVENDVFLSIFNDQYYSSGIFASYRHSLDTASFKRKFLNVSRKYTLKQRMYTGNLLK